MAYDELLEKLDGEKYLLRSFFVLFMNGLPNAFVTTSIAMMTYLPPKFQCIPLLDQTENLTNSINQTIVIDKSHCFYETSEVNSSIPCTSYSFQNPYGKTTIAMEFNWVCQRVGLKSLVLTLFFIGKFLGSSLGFLADRYGRKKVFNYTTYLMFAILLIKSFATTTWLFALLTTIDSGLANLNYGVGFTLSVELIAPKHRNFISLAPFLAFTLGYSITSLVAYYTPDWRWYYRVSSFIGVLFIANQWFVLESPRWLMTKQKTEEAKKTFQSIANINGFFSISKNFQEDVEKEALTIALTNELSTNNSRSKGILQTIKEISKTPKMLFIFVVCAVSRISVALVYFGISFNLQALSGNLFINNALMGLVDVPGLIAMLFFVPKLNRSIAGGFLSITCGVFCIIAAFLESGNPTLSTVFGMIGKALNAGLLHVVHLHTAEIFPTIIRNSCSSIITLVGHIGSAISPSIILLGDTHGMFIPFLVMSSSAVVTGTAYLLFLPNTKNVSLPETVEGTLAMKSLISRCSSLPKTEIELQPVPHHRCANAEDDVGDLKE